MAVSIPDLLAEPSERNLAWMWVKTLLPFRDLNPALDPVFDASHKAGIALDLEATRFPASDHALKCLPAIFR